ncbi:RNA polymerase II-binding domain-containing protein [Aspergillus lucknowensis]|uniref:CID domain-containing protein n=1 Tax=Aspergillus lucknowensis TaxID=176173 RepID=A0ABR4LFJ4_9EURO
MASHQVAIAKASLAAGLLRPDPTSVSRDQITTLHNSLDRALSRCSPANIQTCKNWLLDYVVPSSNRVNLLGKYLAALSGSFEGEDAANPNATHAQGSSRGGQERGRESSTKRKRLHILYLLNDLFHHTKYHNSSSTAFSSLSGSIQAHIVEILSYAASYDREKHPKLHRRLAELLDIWQEHGYWSVDYVGKLREVVANAAVSGPMRTSATPGADTGESDSKSTRDAPYVMPPTHGDPSTPYYDLPAGNLIPHIIPNSAVPLRPDMIKPLQFLAGPADEKLVTALKAFFEEVDRIYAPGKLDTKEGEVVDVDELGQIVIRDADTGDILEGETYYGWSRSFCEQMKKRNARGTQSPRRSESRSRSPKRRRFSDTPSDDSRYRSLSRSRTPPRRRGDRRYDSRSRSRSRSYQRSGSREKSYSPPPPPPSGPQYQRQPQPQPHPQHNSAYGETQGYPQQPPQMPFQHGRNTFPPPPPPPPNYQGPWPPPPPPQMPNFPNFSPAFPQQMQPQMPPGSYNFPPPGGRGWHPPPPPPPSGRGW